MVFTSKGHIWASRTLWSVYMIGIGIILGIAIVGVLTPQSPQFHAPSFNGLGLWVVDGASLHWPDFLDRAERVGASALYLKGHDGTSYGHRNEVYVTRERMVAIKKRGLGVFVWGYNRMDDPEAEAHIITSFLAMGADGYVFNPEKGAIDGLEAGDTAKEVKTVQFFEGLQQELEKRGIPRDSVLWGYSPMPHLRSNNSTGPWMYYHQWCDALFTQAYSAQDWGSDGYHYAPWRLEKGASLLPEHPLFGYFEWDVRMLQHLAVKQYVPLLISESVEDFATSLAYAQDRYRGVGIFGVDSLPEAYWQVLEG